MSSDTTYQAMDQKSISSGLTSRQKKTLLIRQKSFEYYCVDIVKLGSDLSVPICPSGWSWHLTPAYDVSKCRLSRLLRAISLSLS
jgi:hypothetical protein